MIIRTNAPASKTMWLSLLTLSGGCAIYFSFPGLETYAIAAILTGYVILLMGILFKGM